MSKLRLSKRAVTYSAGLFLIVLSALVIGAWLLIAGQLAYQDKIYPGVIIADWPAGGQTKTVAKAVLKDRAKILDQGVEFFYQDKKMTISPSSVSFDGDLAYQLFAANLDQTVEAALAIGRNGSIFNNWQQRLVCQLWSCSVSVAIDYNQPKILELLKQTFGEFESPAEDAALSFGADGRWQVSQEKFGYRFDYQAAAAVFLNNLSRLDNSSIRLILEGESPHIFKAEVEDLSPQLAARLSAAPLTLQFGDQTWTASADDIRSWLGLTNGYQDGRKAVTVAIDEVLLKKYFVKNKFAAVNQTPREAKFEVANGRVSVFQAARDGQEIDLPATTAELNRVLASGGHEAILAVSVTKAQTADSNVNDFGIEEIIGTGTSTFTGSPANRRHNIKVGAAALNGILIKPGEEFSLLKALGKIDAKAGYLQELVIKENKTIPEYGGGLCQIGTTAFRAALASGLPITMRRNHSYRVQYYEPAGTDATIYDPAPDFKFINDSGGYILIQTRIDGDNLIFDFWGKRDGRVIEQSKPVIYNIVRPAASRVVETLDLPVGVKKCTERAHNGASAYFDYKVTYPSGEVKQERFSSYYVPWREVCLIGVDKLSEPANGGSATSTAPQ